MKRTFLCLVTLFFALHLSAQEEIHRNKFIIGGNIYFYKQKNNTPDTYLYIFYNQYEYTTTTLSLNPYIGRELNEHLLFGFQVKYNKSKRVITEQTNMFFSIGDIESKGSGLGIFSRYVFNPQSKIQFFLHGSLGYNRLSKEEDANSFQGKIEEKSTYLDAGLRGGLLVHIANSFYLTGNFGHIFYKEGENELLAEDINTGSKKTTTSKFSTFAASFNASTVSIGLEFQF